MNEENIYREDQINFPRLKKIFFQILRSVFGIIDYLKRTLIRAKYLVLVGFLTGLAVGLASYYSQSLHYDISMVAECSSLRKKVVAELVGSLNDLIKSQSYGKLANEFGIPEQQVRNISYIEATDLNNGPLANDTSSKFNEPFKISARINDPALTDSFQIGIVRYLNNKPLLKTVKEEQVKFYQEKLAFINEELAKLDTLKTAYNHFLASSKSTATIYSNVFDPSEIYVHSDDLINEKGTILYWLSKNTRSFIVIDEFKTPAVPQSFSLSKSLVLWGLSGILFGYLLGLYRELYRETKKHNMTV